MQPDLRLTYHEQLFADAVDQQLLSLAARFEQRLERASTRYDPE